VSAALGGLSAVVTGASRGIGRSTVRALVAAGAKVIGVSRSPTRAGEAAQAGEAGVVADLTDPSAVERAVDAILAQLGGAPDLLVNNAGAFVLAPIEATSPETFARLLAVNLAAPFSLVHAFLAEMRQRRRGHVITVGSLADRMAFPENSAYAASKYGLRGLHEVLRIELAGSGVRATLISPASVDTPLWNGLDAVTRAEFPPASAMLAAQDVTDAILFAVTRPPGVNIDEIRLSAN
jgi:NADP-dependent 3-hydroxy acid dehydrogenase YdfG